MAVLKLVGFRSVERLLGLEITKAFLKNRLGRYVSIVIQSWVGGVVADHASNNRLLSSSIDLLLIRPYEHFLTFDILNMVVD